MKNLSILFASLVLMTCAAVASAGQLHPIPGHIPKVIARLQPLGELNPTNQLDLAIGLPLRNQTNLTQFLAGLYDPSSASYHHFLTMDQFTRQFGPSSNDYQQVIQFASTNGFTIAGEYSNRLLLNVSASAAQIQKAFHIRLNQYQHPAEARLFYAPDTEPQVDSTIPILHISGLNNFQLPQPQGYFTAPPQTLANSQTGGAAGGTGPQGSFRGKDFRNAYVPGTALTGTGQTVGLVEFDGYYYNDITNYAIKARMPIVPLTNVLVGGFSGVPGAGVQDVFEVTLDIEMVASMAPGLSRIMVYETGHYGLSDNVLNRMAEESTAQQLSCSWNFDANSNTAQIFQEFAAQGQSFFTCSQDYDAYNASNGAPVLAPIDYPYAVAVGGTTLTTGTRGAWKSETVWNFGNGTGSGGGISTNYPIPTFQAPVDMSSNNGSATWRNVPDVACIASGFYVIYNNGETTTSGWGTSFATPLWAGFCALANQQAAAHGQSRLGFLDPVLYRIGLSSSYHKAFHDITTGNNTNSASPNNFYAVPGYDLCTGWGTPNGTNLINLLVSPPADIVLSPPVLAGGTLRLSVTGLGVGATNYVQAASNLWPPAAWVSIVTNIATNTSETISGIPFTNAPAQFFRVKEQP